MPPGRHLLAGGGGGGSGASGTATTDSGTMHGLTTQDAATEEPLQFAVTSCLDLSSDPVSGIDLAYSASNWNQCAGALEC